MEWSTLIVLAIGWAMICYAIAVRKNREPIKWSIAGFILGIFAIIMLCIMPTIKKEN